MRSGHCRGRRRPTNLAQVGNVTQVCCGRIICLTFETAGGRMHHAFEGLSDNLGLTTGDGPHYLVAWGITKDGFPLGED